LNSRGFLAALPLIDRSSGMLPPDAAELAQIGASTVLHDHRFLLIFRKRTGSRTIGMEKTEQSSDLLALTTEIVAAHVSNNSVAVGDLPQLINQVYHSLANIGSVPAAPAERPQPAVPVRKSVHPDYIICLEDGKKLKMLKRHLKTAYNMTPEGYRERWGLSSDYPMVAPNYARQRSRLAKEIGLGTRARRPRA
jgi:predicted transcriptional regulator